LVIDYVINKFTPLPATTDSIITCDVCVIGGGHGGIGAAYGAANAGANTVLVEKYMQLGGTLINGLLCTWSQGPGTGGLPETIFNLLDDDPLGVSTTTYSDAAWRTGSGITIEPRTFAMTVEKLLLDTGVTILKGAKYYRVETSGTIIRKVILFCIRMLVHLIPYLLNRYEIGINYGCTNSRMFIRLK
jgi:NADPH-dependent 2,4-dienoyl-CoA reductase/sulfur reductase-like enzyme